MSRDNMPLNRTPPQPSDQEEIDDDMNTGPQQSARATRAAKRQALGSPNPSVTPDAASVGPVTTTQVRDVVQEIIGREMSAFMQQFNNTLRDILNTELKPIKDDVQELTRAVDHMSNQYDDILKEQEIVNVKMKILETENHSLNVAVDDLKKRINQMEQYARSNNAEIQCVPESKNENLLSIIAKLGEVVNCPTAGKNVSHCSRIAKFDSNSGRPRSIVVQFSNPRFRDELLAAVIKFNKPRKGVEKLNVSHLGINESKDPIFVTEHLSPANKDLHAAARQVKKAKNYQYLWVRNGKIFMRKNETSNYILIKDKHTLDKLE